MTKRVISAVDSQRCRRTLPRGWYCTRHSFHMGPCAARRRWWMTAYLVGAVFIGVLFGGTRDEAK